MSLDHLLETLERDAREEADRVLAAARAEADAVQARTETAVAGRMAAALRAREQALRAEAAARLAAVRREGRRALLDARHRALERVRAVVHERMSASEGEAGSLRSRLQAAIACHGGRPVEIRCPPALVAAAREAVGGHRGATVTPDPAAPMALAVRAADGAMEVDASLAGLLERHWPALAIELVRELEPAG